MRIFATMLLAISFAAAQPAWVQDILNPADKAAYCRQIYNAVSTNTLRIEFKTHLVTIEDSTVLFQTPRGTIYSVCSSDAEQIRPMTTDAPFFYLVVLRGVVRELSNAENYGAAVTLYNQQGQEIARLNYDERNSSIASMTDWEVDCTSTSRCLWEGANYYFFIPTTAFLNRISQAHSFGVIANRGEGIKAYRITKANFPGLR